VTNPLPPRPAPRANTAGLPSHVRGSVDVPPACRGRIQPMKFRLAISIKFISVMLFAMMSVLVRYVSETGPLVQAVFFRSVFAIIPVMVIYAWRRELGAAFRTKRPARGHRSRQHVSQFRRWRACRWSTPLRFPSRRPSSPSFSRQSFSRSE